MLSTDARNSTVLVDKKGLEELHHLNLVLIRASEPPRKTSRDKNVMDQIFGHTQRTAKDHH